MNEVEQKLFDEFVAQRRDENPVWLFWAVMIPVTLLAMLYIGLVIHYLVRG